MVAAVGYSREDQLTLLKDVNSKVGLNSRAIVEVMSRLSNFSKTVQSEFEEIDWTMVFDELLKYIYVCNEIRHLGQVMDEAKLRIVEFRQALEVVKSHRLSSKLLPPSEFHSILVNIVSLLPTDVHFAVPVNVEDLFLYYDLCDVQVVSTRTSIRLIVTTVYRSHQLQANLKLIRSKIYLCIMNI